MVELRTRMEQNLQHNYIISGHYLITLIIKTFSQNSYTSYTWWILFWTKYEYYHHFTSKHFIIAVVTHYNSLDNNIPLAYWNTKAFKAFDTNWRITAKCMKWQSEVGLHTYIPGSSISDRWYSLYFIGHHLWQIKDLLCTLQIVSWIHRESL